MNADCSTDSIDDLQAELAQRLDAALDAWTVPEAAPPALAEAMRYAVLGGGKRLRPVIVLLSARTTCNGRPALADPLAAAVALEMVHTYSLVHDDLPAMDDDALRRGRPTVHVKYGEAMAILVGDALVTQAFAVLAERVEDPAAAVALTAELARAAGAGGMIAGQVADMALCDVPDGETGLEYIHARKTAAMFAAAARMGAICGGADDADLGAMAAFGHDLGLAFQIADDVLDGTSTSRQLGKTVGKDAAAGKRTYPALLGLETSTERIRRLSARAVEHLKPFGSAADLLRALVERMQARTN